MTMADDAGNDEVEETYENWTLIETFGGDYLKPKHTVSVQVDQMTKESPRADIAVFMGDCALIIPGVHNKDMDRLSEFFAAVALNLRIRSEGRP